MLYRVHGVWFGPHAGAGGLSLSLSLSVSVSIGADHPYAQALLGYMYLHGMGVERNVKEAVNYFWKSAEQGNSDGILHLANCYFCTYARVLPASSCVPRVLWPCAVLLGVWPSC